MTASTLAVLAITSFIAATFNGALGYGYSSVSVPVALLVTTGRVLNPAIVIVEVGINLYSLFWNRRAARAVLRRVLPLVAGLVPGVFLGAFLLNRIAPSHARLVAFVALLPLILVQASGRRWPLKAEARASVPLGAGVGVLYGLTTISGPPLSLFWNNQGLVKEDFRVALAIVRTIESLCALLAYGQLGLLTPASVELLPWIVPGVLIGFPIGHVLIGRVDAETFRRVCMSFDAYIVAFGLSRTLAGSGIAPVIAYQVMVVSVVIDVVLVLRFVNERRALHAVLHAQGRR